MIDIQKIRDHWKPEEKHELLLIDCAISDIYTLCDELDKHRWIPVSERLPELSDAYRKSLDGTVDVHVLDEFGRVSTENFFPKMQLWNGDIDEIIKWMPIILPKEGE